MPLADVTWRRCEKPTHCPACQQRAVPDPCSHYLAGISFAEAQALAHSWLGDGPHALVLQATPGATGDKWHAFKVPAAQRYGGR